MAFFCIMDFLYFVKLLSLYSKLMTAGPGVTSSIPARSYTFVEIYHEIISMAILLPSADSRIISKSMCTKYWLTALSSLSKKRVRLD